MRWLELAPSVETKIAIDRDSSSDPPVYSSLHPFPFQSAYPFQLRDVHFFLFYFFDLGEVLAPSPRKLGKAASLRSSLLFNYKKIPTLMEICSVIQVNTD